MSEPTKTREIDKCRFCGKALLEHAERRDAWEPVPRMPCLGLREHFVATVVQDGDPPRPTLPPLGEPYPILQWFTWEHLPAPLQVISRPFAELALELAARLPPGPETAAGLRKLLEAADCMVRAAMTKPRA